MKQLIFALLASALTQSAIATTSISVTPESTQEYTASDYGSYWFGRVTVNSRNVARFTVKNTGDEPLDYVQARIWGMFFDAYHNCNRTLLPQEKCRFDIVYWPSFEGYHSGDFQLDFKQDSVVTHVSGDAVKRF